MEEAHTPHTRRRRFIVGLSVACGVILLTGFPWWFFSIRDSGPIPRQYTKGVHYALYYPTRLPNGYHVDPASFQRKDNVLIFSIIAPGGRNIAASLQPAPPDAGQRSKKGLPISLPGERDFETPTGHAYIGLWGKNYVADIVTKENTWIILNVTGFTADEAESVTQSFTAL